VTSEEFETIAVEGIAALEGIALLVPEGRTPDAEVAVPLDATPVAWGGELGIPPSRSAKRRCGARHPDTVEEPMQNASRQQIRLRMA
jgi:hypothetical protein